MIFLWLAYDISTDVTEQPLLNPFQQQSSKTDNEGIISMLNCLHGFQTDTGGVRKHGALGIKYQSSAEQEFFATYLW